MKKLKLYTDGQVTGDGLHVICHPSPKGGSIFVNPVTVDMPSDAWRLTEVLFQMPVRLSDTKEGHDSDALFVHEAGIPRRGIS